MINRKELITSKEYWMEKIQNTLFFEVEKFIEKNKLTRTKFAKRLGVSKSYLSQVLNGNFDHKLSKLIELSLAIDKIPIIRFEETDKCLLMDKQDKLSVTEKHDINVNLAFDFLFSTSTKKTNSNGSVFKRSQQASFSTPLEIMKEKRKEILA